MARINYTKCTRDIPLVTLSEWKYYLYVSKFIVIIGYTYTYVAVKYYRILKNRLYIIMKQTCF